MCLAIKMQTEILLSTIEEGSIRPSFFELFLMDKMSSMVKPAIRHIFYSASLQSTDPDIMLSAFETLYSFIYSIVEGMCLFAEGNNASLMEGIYGYQRARPNPIDNNTNVSSATQYLPLTQNQKVFSLLYFIIMPRMLSVLKAIRSLASYLDRRDQRIDEENSRNDMSSSSFIVRLLKRLIQGVLSVHRKALKYGVQLIAHILPHLLALESMTTTVFYILYLLKIVPQHHPLFALLNMELVKKTSLSAMNVGVTTVPSTGAASTTASIQPSTLSSAISSSRGWHLTAIVGVMFALRAADWMVNTDHSADHINNRLGLVAKPPPPPKPLKVARGGVIPLQDGRLCSLCGKIRTNPCAASSGYVFCYICILDFVRDNGKCPVTHLPCLERDLIRLFENPEA